MATENPAIRFSPKAQRDLEEIRAYSEERWAGRDSERFLSSLAGQLDRLAAHPGIGRERPDLGTGLRCVPHPPYVVYYILDGGRPVVLAILHERRDHRRADFTEWLKGG